MLFCLHKYGKWSKLSKGFKSRRCSKCRNVQKRRASEWDRLFCWHKYQRSYKKGGEKRCLKCDKVSAR